MTIETTCPVCKGTGVMTDENGIVYDDACPDCAGTGKDLQVGCDSCGSWINLDTPGRSGLERLVGVKCYGCAMDAARDYEDDTDVTR